ncbi:uncharacterized protein cubi_00707 [Cryptosporidium ubiquitum]|uniref:Uncharacterized protein n=1 Tax=Cryptosporidium ubiquitum TaxID=857276 RepID=A0A1J4MEK5_9CRYT|nr:uncharacterized protein cubi_00707 [Cryptosporidium ubiquitum]OII71899.1 hypothetical protein cubi_00707 [Cryptosporidium ubiquitum]
MEEDLIEKIISNIIITLDPSKNTVVESINVGNCMVRERSQAEYFLDTICDQDNLRIDEVVFEVLKSAKYKSKNGSIGEDLQHGVEFISLSILDKFVKRKWVLLSNEDKSRVRNKLLEISVCGIDCINDDLILVSSSFAIRKLCCTFSRVIIQDYFVSWKVFMKAILDYRNKLVNFDNSGIVLVNENFLRNRNITNLTKLVLGITKEISETLINSNTNEINSKMRASSTNGLCNEIEPVLHIISNELRNACNFKRKEKMLESNISNYDISLIKQSLDCLKNLTNIIDSGKLLNLRLDDLLIILHNTGILDSNEEILDLLDSLVQNLTKQKKGAIFVLDYQDLNRFVLGVANLVKNTILNPKLFSEDPDYDTSLMHLNWIKLFKDLIEGCIPAIVRIPDNITLENSNNKMDVIILVWKITLAFCMHPYISVCDLAVSTLCQILKILVKELPSLYKDESKYFYLVKGFQIDILLVFLYIRSLRIGDPKINYLTDEWNPWNSMISNMIFNSLTKLNSETVNILFHFPNQPYNFSLIASKYFKLLDQYNIVDSSHIKFFGDVETSENMLISKNSSNNLGSFNNSYSSLKTRIIQLVNSLVDFGQGILLEKLMETCLNIAVFIFSSHPFNSRCSFHSSENSSNNSSVQNLCQKCVFIDGMFLILETILNRISFNIHNLPKNDAFLDPSTKFELKTIPSFFDLLSQDVNYKEQKVWISSLFKLMNGILQLPLLELCGHFLESRRLIFISQTVICVEWYQELYKDVSTMIKKDGILSIYMSYLTNSGGLIIPELRKTASYCLSRILLSQPKLFEENLSMVIQVINESLNSSGTCFEEKMTLSSVLIAATNAEGNFNRISESCEMASKVAFSLLSRNSFNFSNQEEVLDFLFRDLVEAVRMSREPSEQNWKNLVLLKNSLTLLFSVFGNVKLPDEFSSLKNGGFLKEERSHLVLRHPLEKLSRQIFDSICLITLVFLKICDNSNKSQLEELNIISLFNSISDQEWMARSGIKNQSDFKIIKLSQITSYRMIFYNSFLQIRRLTFSIRNLLIKLLVSTFTLGTCKDIFHDQAISMIPNPGLYFEEGNVNLLLKTLIDPIRSLPIHILNFIIKNGWYIIFSPQSLPRFQDGYPTDIFLEEVFSNRFVPSVLDKLRSEWQKLMISQAYILSSSISELRNLSLENVSSSIPFQDPFRVLLNLNIDFKEFPSNLKDNSLYNVIYNSHYNDLSETSFIILKIVNRFILSTNRQSNSSFKLKTEPKLSNHPVKLKSGSSNNEDFQMDYYEYHYNQNHYYEDYEFQDPMLMDYEETVNYSSQKSKTQPKHISLSQVFLLNQNLMKSSLEILIEFLNFPDPNILETSLHIIQKYLQQYINFTNQGNHSKYSDIHISLIKNLLIQLLKVGPRALPFDPLNLSPSKSDNIKIPTPLNSYIKLSHPNLLKNAIIDCIQSIIRSDQDCLNFINNTKNELSKDLSKNITNKNFSSPNLLPYNDNLYNQQVPIPDEILKKAYNCLEFLFSKYYEYSPSGSEKIFSQQDIILICKTFLEEHITDIVFSQTSVLGALIGNILHSLSQISSQNEQNPYINFTTFIKPSFQ